MRSGLLVWKFPIGGMRESDDIAIMTHSRKIVLAFVTHGTGLALGWFGWSHWRSSPAEESLRPAASKREVVRTVLTPDEVLEFVQEPSAQAEAQREHDNLMAEFDRLVATMEVPADLEAALSKELAGWLRDDSEHRRHSPKIMALLYHWTVRDVAGMLKWAGSDPGGEQAVLWHSFQVFEKAAKEHGPEILSGGLDGKFAGFTAHFAAQALAEIGDVDRVLALKDSLSETQWLLLRGRFGSSWPFEGRESMAALVAATENQPDMLFRFAQNHGPEGIEWLTQVMADGSFDSSFREQLRKSELWKDLAKNTRLMPLDERVEQIRGDGEPGRDVFGEIADRDLNEVLKEGRDWRHAFRHGQADAAEVLAEISRSLPELAARAPEALRNQLFIQLAEEDPNRAMGLLEGLSDDEKAKIAIQAPLWHFVHIDPNHFLAALAHVPADTPELWNTRLDAWDSKTAGNYARLSEDYVAWVRQLPPGVDREMALFSLAKAAADGNGELAAELRAELGDETLKQKWNESR